MNDEEYARKVQEEEEEDAKLHQELLIQDGDMATALSLQLMQDSDDTVRPLKVSIPSDIYL